MQLKRFFREARRRKVYTVAGAYVGLSLVMHQLGGALFDAFEFPDVALRVLTILLLLFFPIVLVLAWIFDIGPEGLQRTAALPDNKQTYQAPSMDRGWQLIEHTPAVTAAEPIPELVPEAPAPERVQRAAIALIRHELRTPINAIIGYSEMLLEDAQDQGDAEMTEGLTSILGRGRELAGLVDAILGAERVEAEQRDLQSYAAQVRADMETPLRAVIGTAENLVQRSHGTVTLLTPDLNRVLAAARKLLDLSSDIGAITEGTHAQPAHLAQATSIAEDVLSKLRSVAGDAPSPDRQGHLLIVDDSPINRDLLARQLAHKGYMITTAENGRQALERMSEEGFDLVLLDVLMPELDGVETLRRIKSDGALRDIPVIMISALDEIDSVIRCLEIGAADFLSKPFHPTLLDARIGATLKAARRGHGEPQRGNTVEIVSAGFPRHLARRVRDGDRRIVESASDAAVLVLDVEHAVAKLAAPAQRAGAIDALTRAARLLADKHAIDSVIVRGGHVVIMAGFPLTDDSAAENITRLAQTFSAQCEQLGLPCRGGLHRGAVHGAVVGTEAPSFWLWGDGFELARKLAGAAERGRMLVSPVMHRVLQNRFPMSNAGVTELAGHGQVRCHMLDRIAGPDLAAHGDFAVG